MTTKEVIRFNLDDQAAIGMASEVSDGENAVYELNNKNVWDVIIKDKDGVVVNADNYTVFPGSGQIKGVIPQGDFTVEYQHAGFSDTELDYLLGELDDSTNKATLACIEILLASAAKRFDYKAGLKDLKASQVFDHLKDLYATYQDKVQAEDDANGLGNVGLVVSRLHPAYTVNLNLPDNDVSRRD